MGTRHGRRRAERAFVDHAARRGLNLAKLTTADSELLHFSERLLAGAIGAAELRAAEDEAIAARIDGLAKAGRPQVVVCGIESHVCVLQSALGFKERFALDVFGNHEQRLADFRNRLEHRQHIHSGRRRM